MKKGVRHQGERLLIKVDDLQGPEIIALLQEHLQEMKRISPPESVHALDLTGLRKPDVTFWTAWRGPDLVGCGALKMLSSEHGEIKSMRAQGQILFHHSMRIKGVRPLLLPFAGTSAELER